MQPPTWLEGGNKWCLTSIKEKEGPLASVLTLCLKGRCWHERGRLCILAPTCGRQVWGKDGWQVCIAAEGENPIQLSLPNSSCSRLDERLGSVAQRAFSLQRAWMINTSSLPNTSMWNVCWAAGFAFRIANSPLEWRQNQICASYCFVETKECQRSHSTLPLQWQLCFWVWRSHFGRYSVTIHHMFSTSLHLTKLALAPTKFKAFCHWFWWGLF